MQDAATDSKKRGLIIAVICIGLLACGGLYAANAGLFDGSSRDLASNDADRVMDALSTMDNEKLASSEYKDARAKAMETLKSTSLDRVFDRLRSDDLSEEQRESMRSNLGAMIQEDMQKKMDEYSSAPEEEKEAIMDRHIDEMVAFRDKMRAYRDEHKDDPGFEKEREERRNRRRSPTKQQRKERMEKRNPDRTAQMMRYWPKMMVRASERGIKMGFGRGGGKGGDKKESK